MANGPSLPAPASTAVVPYPALVAQFRSAPPGKLYCLHGDPVVFRMSLAAAAHVLLNGIPVALVDGTNHFDVYYLAEFARRYSSRLRVDPSTLLDNIFVSRAFTCYQMEAAITERLPAFLARRHATIAIVFGLLDTFYDEQAPLYEVTASVQRIIAALQRLKRSNVSVLLAARDQRLASHERNVLFPRVRASMDRVFRVTEQVRGARIEQIGERG